VLESEGQKKDGRDVFLAVSELGRSFHQVGTFNEKVSESVFVPLWDGTIKRRSLAECAQVTSHIINVYVTRLCSPVGLN